MMPKSAKGGGRNRAQKKLERYSVPITGQRCRSQTEGSGQRAEPAEASLLLQGDGSAWGDNPGQYYHRQVDKVVTAIGLDPAEVTMYCLRTMEFYRQDAAA